MEIIVNESNWKRAVAKKTAEWTRIEIELFGPRYSLLGIICCQFRQTK